MTLSNLMHRSTLALVLMMIVGFSMAFVACTRVAFAADAPTAVASPTVDQNPSTDTSPQDIARNIYDAVRAGRWMAVIGGVLMLIVWGTRKLLVYKKVEWFGSPTGGRVLAFGLALLTILGTALVAREAPNLSLFAGAFAAAWVAAGQWEDVKDGKAKAESNQRRAETGPITRGS